MNIKESPMEHSRIYDKINGLEVKYSSLMTGVKVVSFIVLVFGAASLIGVFSLVNSITDNTKALVEIKTILKAVDTKAKMIDTNEKRIRELEIGRK